MNSSNGPQLQTEVGRLLNWFSAAEIIAEVMLRAQVRADAAAKAHTEASKELEAARKVLATKP